MLTFSFDGNYEDLLNVIDRFKDCKFVMVNVKVELCIPIAHSPTYSSELNPSSTEKENK